MGSCCRPVWMQLLLLLLPGPLHRANLLEQHGGSLVGAAQPHDTAHHSLRAVQSHHLQQQQVMLGARLLVTMAARKGMGMPHAEPRARCVHHQQQVCCCLAAAAARRHPQRRAANSGPAALLTLRATLRARAAAPTQQQQQRMQEVRALRTRPHLR